jgi:hypothetical protein
VNIGPSTRLTHDALFDGSDKPVVDAIRKVTEARGAPMAQENYWW